MNSKQKKEFVNEQKKKIKKKLNKKKNLIKIKKKIKIQIKFQKVQLLTINLIQLQILMAT